jgi:N utilization substance protein B
MHGKRRARILALQFLYQIDIRGDEVLPVLGDFLSSEPEEASAYAESLVKGCVEKREELDSEISKWSENWDIQRMATVDRNVLRIAAYELLFVEGVPPKVAIDEAIELAKEFGDADSPSFVNGIIDSIYRSRSE